MLDLLRDFTQTHYAGEDVLLKAVRMRAEMLERGQILVPPETGALLAWLIRLTGAKKIAEFGTFLGYSALWMARAMEEDGKLWTMEKDAASAAEARIFFKRDAAGERITVLEGDAAMHLEALAGQAPFDLVFIDADKAAYPGYAAWARRVLKPGGLLVMDNALLNGSVAGEGPTDYVRRSTWEKLQALHRELAGEAWESIMLLPSGNPAEAVTLSIKKER